LPLLLYFSTSGRFVLGGAKPVPINPYNFKNPRRDMALSSLAGPGANVLIAISCALVLRVILPLSVKFLPETAWEPIALPVTLMFGYGAFISVALAVFNMLPIPPLDGSRIAYWLLPEKLAAMYYRFESFGILIVFALFALGLLGTIIWPIIIYVLYFLLGNDILVFLFGYFFK
jgi:Zn-dependent protease